MSFHKITFKFISY